MKPGIGVIAALGFVNWALGQGAVNFANSSLSSTWISTNSISGGPATGLMFGPGGAYYFALFVAPSTITSVTSLDPIVSGFAFTGYIGTNRAVAGRFTGNPTTDDCAIAGYPIGSSASFVVVGWSASIGTNWTQAQSWLGDRTVDGWYGESAVATSVTLGGDFPPPGNIFGTQPGNAPGFTLNHSPIPEPATLPIAGLAVLILLRSRQARRHPPLSV